MKKFVLFLLLLIFFWTTFWYDYVDILMYKNINKQIFSKYQKENKERSKLIYSTLTNKIKDIFWELKKRRSIFNNNIIFKLNEKMLNKKINDVLMKSINIKNKYYWLNVQTIQNKKIKKILEVETNINNADYLILLAIPLNKFLIKQDINWKYYIVEYNNNYKINWKIDLKSDITNEINMLLYDNDIDEFQKELKKYKDHWKEYQKLFTIYPFSQFVNNFNFKISLNDNRFKQYLLNKDKLKYYNSLFYIPSFLRNNKELLSKYIFFYIPITYNNQIKAISKSILINKNWWYWMNWKRWFENMALWSIKFLVELNTKNSHWSDIIKLWWQKIHLWSIYPNFYSTTQIIIKKESLLKSLLLLLAMWLWFSFWYLFIKIIDKKIDEISKFEREEISN